MGLYDGATFTSGEPYTVYCDVIPDSPAYAANTSDSAINCVPDCNANPQCAAVYFVDGYCYFYYAPITYKPSDGGYIVVRVDEPPPYYPDSTTTTT